MAASKATSVRLLEAMSAVARDYRRSVYWAYQLVYEVRDLVSGRVAELRLACQYVLSDESREPCITFR